MKSRKGTCTLKNIKDAKRGCKHHAHLWDVAMAKRGPAVLSTQYERCLARMRSNDEKLLACNQQKDDIGMKLGATAKEIAKAKEEMTFVLDHVAADRAKLMSEQENLLKKLSTCHARIAGCSGGSSTGRSPL